MSHYEHECGISSGLWKYFVSVISKFLLPIFIDFVSFYYQWGFPKCKKAYFMSHCSCVWNFTRFVITFCHFWTPCILFNKQSNILLDYTSEKMSIGDIMIHFSWAWNLIMIVKTWCVISDFFPTTIANNTILIITSQNLQTYNF